MEKGKPSDYVLPAHLLGEWPKQPGRERQRGQQPIEKVIGSFGREWIIDASGKVLHGKILDD